MQQKSFPDIFESHYLQRAGVPQHDRTLIPISIVVVAMHVILLLFSANITDPPPIPKPKERLVVKTISLNSRMEILDPPVEELQEMESVAEIPPPPPPPPPPEPKVELIALVVETPIPELEPIKQEPEKELEKPVEKPLPEPIPEPEIKTEPLPEPENKPEPKPEPVSEPKPKSEPKPQPKPKPEPKPEKKKPLAPKKNQPAPLAKKKEKKPEIPQKKQVEKPVVAKKKEEKKKPQPKKNADTTIAKKNEPKPVKKKESEKTEAKKKSPPSKKEPAAASEAKKTKTDKKMDSSPAEPKVDPAVIAAQEASKAKRRELLSSAQKSIAKIERTHDTLGASQITLGPAPAVPRAIESLQIEALLGSKKQELSPQEIGYHEELAGRLKLLLRLPEFGEVKIKLTLERSGRFVKVVIVNAESTSNRKYIEKTLPALKYPSFGNNFSDQDEYTFVVALSNE